MKFRTAAVAALAAMMAIAPVSSAFAYGHHHWRGGPLIGLVALGAAAVVGTAAILSAPVEALAAPPPYYDAPPPPAYYGAPPPAYYAPPYYDAPPRGVYAPPPVYYAPPVYYYR